MFWNQNFQIMCILGICIWQEGIPWGMTAYDTRSEKSLRHTNVSQYGWEGQAPSYIWKTLSSPLACWKTYHKEMKVVRQ